MYLSRTIIDMSRNDITDPVERITILPIFLVLLATCNVVPVPFLCPLDVISNMNIMYLLTIVT